MYNFTTCHKHVKLDCVIVGPPAVYNYPSDISLQLLLEVGGEAGRWEGSGGGRDVSAEEFSECQPSQ